MHSVICSGLGLECFVIIKCTKFGQLILRKIMKIVATRCQILRLKCTKFDPRPRWRELTALPQTLAGFKGLTSKGRGREGRGRGRRDKEKGREEGVRGREGKTFPFPDFTI